MNFIKKNIIPIVLIAISILSFYRLVRPGYFSMQDDMHVLRLQQFDKCIQDLQIPCRYVPDAGFGYGYPLFNFYSPLPYLIAESFHLLSFSYIDSIKIVFILGHIIGVLGMYFFTLKYWGKYGAFISAVLFLFAPYQSTDSYVRGAIAEFLAINIVPWIFFGIDEIFLKNKINKIFIFSLFSLLICHNLTVLTFIPIFTIYTLIKLFFDKSKFLKIFTSVIFSFGLSAFFLLPAIFEQKFVNVHTMTQGYFYYIIHFATLSQLFISRFWGYGASLWGPIDDMAFSIGQIQWIIPIIVLISIFVKNKMFSKKNIIYLIFFYFVFLVSIFLTHSKSTPFWQIFSFMPYYQFPWRFLAATIFSLSFIGGSVVLIFKKNISKKIALVLIVAITIILNINYFKEDIWFSKMTDNQKLTGEELIRQSGAGLKDYWPKYGEKFPEKMSNNIPFSDSKISVINFKKYSNLVSSEIISENNSHIIMPVVYFPQWQVYVDNNKTEYKIDKEIGLISFDLTPGTHKIIMRFTNTPIRTLANTISIITFFVISFYFYKRKI